MEDVHEESVTYNQEEDDVGNDESGVIIPEYKMMRLGRICIVGALSLAFVYLTVNVGIEFILFRLHPDVSVDKQFDALDEQLYYQMAQETIPYVQSWYRQDHSHELLLPTEKLSIQRAPQTCLNLWMDDLRPAVPQSHPAWIELVLHHMELHDIYSIRQHMQVYLDEPQSLDRWYDQAQTCLAWQHGLGEFACELKQYWSWNIAADNLRRDQWLYAHYTVHVMLTVQVLTTALQDDRLALTVVSQRMQDWGTRRKYLDAVYPGDSDMIQWQMDQYMGAAAALAGYLQMTSQNTGHSNLQNTGLVVNLLEAVQRDAQHSYDANARLGTALAQWVWTPAGLAMVDRIDSSNNNNNDGTTKTIPTSSSSQQPVLVQPLGKRWVDAYTTWNLAFRLAHLPLHAAAGQLLPCLSCSSTADDQAQNWLRQNIVASSLQWTLQPTVERTARLSNATLGQLMQPPFAPGDLELLANYMSDQVHPAIQPSRYHVVNQLGELNLHTNRLASPSRSSLEEMFYTLCGETCYDDTWKVSHTAPHDDMNNHQNQVYIGFIIWASTVIEGIGLEIFVWLKFLQSWGYDTEYYWRAAQFVFPLLMITALGLAAAHNFLALPIFVVSLWKFGYPETIMYLYLGLYGTDHHWLERASDLLNGIGTLVHHSAVAFIKSMLLTGAAPPNRYLYNICMILTMQHWFALVKYWNDTLYIALQLFLEFWLEWLIISNLWPAYKLSWTLSLGAAVMLVAHWMYLAAGMLSLVARRSAEGDENVHTRGTKAFRRPTMEDDYLDDGSGTEPSKELFGSKRSMGASKRSTGGSYGNLKGSSSSLGSLHARRRGSTSMFYHSQNSIMMVMQQDIQNLKTKPVRHMGRLMEQIDDQKKQEEAAPTEDEDEKTEYEYDDEEQTQKLEQLSANVVHMPPPSPSILSRRTTSGQSDGTGARRCKSGLSDSLLRELREEDRLQDFREELESLHSLSSGRSMHEIWREEMMRDDTEFDDDDEGANDYGETQALLVDNVPEDGSPHKGLDP